MRITRLALTDFRNHADALIEASAGLVLITGENGVGKTNILEAISLLAPGRSLRGSSLGEMARRDGPGGFAVAARLEGADGPIDLGTGAAETAPERRLVRINGATASANSLAEWLSLLWITPAMDRLFNEPASARRRFLDRLVLALEPGHATHSARYEAAMRARNKLLADSVEHDPAWLASLEAAMAEHGAQIAQARERTVAALAAGLADPADTAFPRATVALDRSVPPEAELRELFARSRTGDAAAGRALTGPHRMDLLVTHADKAQPAEGCSTGEQKALLLGLVLAHAELVAARSGRPPVLLLDEVAAHLDSRRRAALFERLRAWGGQVWMTGTDAALFDAVEEDATRLRLG